MLVTRMAGSHSLGVLLLLLIPLLPAGGFSYQHHMVKKSANTVVALFAVGSKSGQNEKQSSSEIPLDEISQRFQYKQLNCSSM